MIPKRRRNKGKFYLKVRDRAGWLQQAGTHIETAFPPRVAAQTTRHFPEAQSFGTYGQAERMQRLLIERYGLKTMIVKFKGGDPE